MQHFPLQDRYGFARAHLLVHARAIFLGQLGGIGFQPPNSRRRILSRALPLRLIVGYGFMAHGYAKLAKGPDAFVDIVHTIGVPAPHFMARLAILVELLGGLAVLLGAFVPLVSLPIGSGSPGRHIYCPSALRFHLDQTHGRDRNRTPIWTARL